MTWHHFPGLHQRRGLTRQSTPPWPTLPLTGQKLGQALGLSLPLVPLRPHRPDHRLVALIATKGRWLSAAV